MRDQEAIETFGEENDAKEAPVGLDANPVTSFSSLLTLFHLTPFVLAARLPKLIAETGVYSPLDREETRLAVVEKVGAGLEGVVACQCQFAASVLAMQAAAFEGRFAPNDYVRGFGELTSTALKPVVDRLQSNVSRLS